MAPDDSAHPGMPVADGQEFVRRCAVRRCPASGCPWARAGGAGRSGSGRTGCSPGCCSSNSSSPGASSPPSSLLAKVFSITSDQSPCCATPQNWNGGRDSTSRMTTGCVVIPGQAVDRQAEIAREVPEALVPGAGLVLDEIARRQDHVRPARIGKRVLQRGHQGVVRVHATHARVALRVQVRIGDVQDAQRSGPWRDYSGGAGRPANGFRRRRSRPAATAPKYATTVALCAGLSGDDARVLATRGALAAAPQETRLRAPRSRPPRRPAGGCRGRADG